jgi:hypothetical protein
MSAIPQADASLEDTMVPPDLTITDSAGQVWSLGISDAVGHRLLREGVQFADGQGVLLLFHGQQVFTRNSRNEWFVATTTEWQPVPGDPRPQPEGKKILAVPYLSQLGPSANFALGDCGSSDVAMILRFHGAMLTVNDVSIATGQPHLFTALSITDLIDVAARFGLMLRHELNFSMAGLHQQIDAGKPCLVLVNYPFLPHRFDHKYTRGHFLVVVGQTKDGLIYHDPYFPGSGGEAIEILDADLDTAWSTLPENGDFTIPRQVLLDVTFMSPGL